VFIIIAMASQGSGGYNNKHISTGGCLSDAMVMRIPERDPSGTDMV